MMMDKVKEYTSKFPFGLEEFTASLSCKTSLAIVYLLYEKGELDKDEIIQQFGEIDVHDEVLINASIRNLSNYGIIARTKSKMIGTEVISKFKINNIYRRLLDSCIEVLEVLRIKRDDN